MHPLVNFLFGPLSRDYCSWFLLTTGLSLLGLVAAGASTLYLAWNYVVALGTASSTTSSVKNLYYSVTILAQAFLAYLVNRLMYTMCMRSIQ